MAETIKPLTIDDLGIDASNRYARDQRDYEARYIEESRFIPQRTEVPVVKPYAPSEFDQKYSVGKSAPWARFSTPPDIQQDKDLFSYQLIPSLGNYEKLEAASDKLEKIEGSGKEKKAITDLLQIINQFNKILESINAKRNQYQRG